MSKRAKNKPKKATVQFFTIWLTPDGCRGRGISQVEETLRSTEGAVQRGNLLAGLI
jgi:hypothetical protein